MISINNSDDFLEALVGYVTSEDTELHITLIVDGMLVTGNLISGYQYFEHMKKLFPESEKRVSETEVAAYVRETVISAHSNNYAKLKGEIVTDLTFLHMANAKFHYSAEDDLSGHQGVMWRGTIEKVSGFHFPQPKITPSPKSVLAKK